MADQKLETDEVTLTEDVTAPADTGKDNMFDTIDDIDEPDPHADPEPEPELEAKHGVDAHVYGDDHADHEDHEERHGSLSSRILTGLVLMAVGAGAVLWGGPKLAPNLPQWAAPVARVLTPGGDLALQEVTALRQEVASQLDALPPPVDGAALQAAASAVASEGDAALSARLDGLETRLAESTQGDLIGRVSTMESRIEGVSAEVASLNATLSEAITTGGDMSAETLAQLAAKDSVIEGLRAELDRMAAQLGALSQRIEDVDAAARERAQSILTEAQLAEQQAAELARQAALQDSHSTLMAAAASGRGFQAALDAFAETSGIAVPEQALSYAAAGLPPLSDLEEEFTAASHLAIRASIKESAGEGALSRVSAFFQSQVATRSLVPQDGQSTDAILSRMGAALALGDMATVLTEAEALDEPSRAPLTGFLNKARLRHNVLSALAALNTKAS